MTDRKKKKLVFGMGSGRCGTSSLAYLLNSQEGALVAHELSPILPWDFDRNGIQFRWDQLNHQANSFNLVGDVGIYYLPYVRFLAMSLRELLVNSHEFKFVILKREKSQVVESYLRKFKSQNNNPLQNHRDPNLWTDEWDLSFPKYDGVTLEEAVCQFYDDYYAEAKLICDKHPDLACVFDVESLNTEQGVLDILSFVGVENPVVMTEVRKNTGVSL